jgi:metal-sulfur cluster biosynthetic enzyme
MTDSPTLDHAPNQPVVAAQSAIPADELQRLTDDIVAALKTVYDPEIPSDIYELGLIYSIDIDDSRFVTIEMTLTAPACPVAGEMPGWVENAVSAFRAPRSTWSSIRHGTRAACRTRRASPSICGERGLEAPLACRPVRNCRLQLEASLMCYI